MKKKILSIACVLVSAIAFAQVPTSGLVAHYPFNGNANDESTNSNDGTVNGATLTTDRFGNANSAYSFDGVDDFIDCGNGGSLQFDSYITFSAWIKAESIGHMSILDKLPSSLQVPDIGFRINTRVGGKVWAEGGNAGGNSIPGGNGVVAESEASYQVGQWVHVVGVLDSTVVSIYIDGQLKDTVHTNLVCSNTNNLLIWSLHDLNKN